jgi:dihydromethanopterin reductase
MSASCAIGKHGQLGLNGRLPWEGNPGTEYKADVQRFFALTRGHVVIAGPRTIASFPDWARSERTLVEIHSADEPNAILKSYCDRVVYVGGGPPVWNAYAHLIRHWDVTRLPYDGEADRYFDPELVVRRVALRIAVVGPATDPVKGAIVYFRTPVLAPTHSALPKRAL